MNRETGGENMLLVSAAASAGQSRLEEAIGKLSMPKVRNRTCNADPREFGAAATPILKTTERMLLFGTRSSGCLLAAFLVCLGLPTHAPGQLANGIIPTNMGKGDWTFYLSSAESNLGQSSAQALFNYEASQGVKWVVVKAQDGTTTGDWGYSASVVTAAHNAGLKIFAYAYVYGNYYSSSGEANELSTTLSMIKSIP